MEWRISSGLAERLIAEAGATPDVEICGLLFGAAGRVEAAQLCQNVADRGDDSFEIDPVALLAAHTAQRSGGPAITGCYHSHPNGRALPSARDAESPLPGLWIIAANGRLHGWQHDGAGRFVKAPLRLISALSAESP